MLAEPIKVPAHAQDGCRTAPLPSTVPSESPHDLSPVMVAFGKLIPFVLLAASYAGANNTGGAKSKFVQAQNGKFHVNGR